MNKYRRFKYPFGGETPQEFADARRAYYENVSNTALQAINAAPAVNANTVTQPFDETSPREYLRQYTERVRPEVERRINEMNRRPSGNGKIIRNHDKLYDYYKDGDKLYYRKKGGKNWIDISDNDVAQKRINATIARNKRSYSKPKNSSSQTVEDNKTYDAGTLNDVVVTSTRRKAPTLTSRRVQGANSYKKDSTKKSSSYQPVSTQGISGLGPYKSTVPLTDQERKSTPGAIASTVFRKVKDWLTNSNNRYNQRNGITGNNTSSIVSTRGVGAYR